MMIDHTFRVAGGAGGVIDADGIPLIVGHQPDKFSIATAHQFFVILDSQSFTCLPVLCSQYRISIINQQRSDLSGLKSSGYGR